MKKYVLRPPTGRTFRIDYEKSLNPQQQEVVFAGDGPMLVVAGAGSGKTRTLTYRVARLLESGIAPPSVILLTFTNKAAREMLHRVEALIETDVRRMVGGTFHHAGNIFLRKHAKLVGFTPGFTILDRTDAADLLDDLASKRRNLQEAPKIPKGNVLLDIHSYEVNTGHELGRVITARYPVFLPLADEIRRVFRRYNERKRELNLMDFDDLLLFWREVLLENPNVLEAERARFRYLLVDEYQDTNRLQADVVETIAGPEGNIMVVGDDSQSIYSFRGADFGNIIGFPERFPNCGIFKLETNYRSTPEVLALANSSIRHNEVRFEKALRTDRLPGAKPEIISCGGSQEQASFIVQRMLELRDEGMEFKDMAVLYRAHWHSMDLQVELARYDIPFQVRSGLRFFEQAHIKDVTAYLKITANPKDELAWKRVLKLYPKIGIKTADKIFTVLESTADPISSLNHKKVLAKVPKAARDGWKDFSSLLKKLRGSGRGENPADMIRAVVDGGYDRLMAANYVSYSTRVEDLRRFSDYAMRFRSLDEILTELALTSGIVAEESIEEPEDTDWTVLSTVHQAKGLEWDVVFIVMLVDGKFPDARSIRDEGGEEEERRLFYVGVTRARDQLFLVYPVVVDERGLHGVIQHSSRFLEELDVATYEKGQAIQGFY